MAVYRKYLKPSVNYVSPNPKHTTGLKIMTSPPVRNVMRVQDLPVQMTRRIIGQVGLNANDDWMVPEVDPVDGSQLYPDDITEREVGKFKCKLTPGAALGLSVLAMPCSETSVYTGSPDYEGAGKMGYIKLDITWDTGAATKTAEHVESLPISAAEYGAVEDGTYSSQMNRTIRRDYFVITPDNFLTNVTNSYQYSAGVDCTVEISMVGGCRIIDCVVYEYPYYLAYHHSASASDWAAGLYSSETTTLDYPTESGPGTTDPRHGTDKMLQVLEGQAKRLGPTLFSWTCYEEQITDVTDDVPDDLQISATTTKKNIFETSLSTWDADAPGFSMSCGGYGRRGWYAGETKILKGTGVVPVRITVTYDTVNGNSHLRFMTSAHSYFDMHLTSTTDTTASAWGFVECGINPEQQSYMQVFVWSDSTDTVELYYINAEYYHP